MDKIQELIDGLFTDGGYDARRARTGAPPWLLACEGDTIAEKVWLHFHKRPRCGQCGSLTKWINYSQGYRKNCSKKCGQASIAVQKSIHREQLWSNEEWRETATYAMKVAHHNSRTQTKLAALKAKNIVPLEEIRPGMQNVYRWQHCCGEVFQRPFTRTTGIWCPICHVSRGQGELYEAIKARYSGPILVNDRKVLSPKEIDIYLPELKLGFEYHGEYWHPGDGTKEHTKILMAAELGIHIEEFWETLWKQKRQQQLTRLDELLK